MMHEAMIATVVLMSLKVAALYIVGLFQYLNAWLEHIYQID
jgi:hypothetical protein